jgi:hypothetical protein
MPKKFYEIDPRLAGWQAQILGNCLDVANTKLFMEQNALKIVNNCWNTKNNTFYSFSE